MLYNWLERAELLISNEGMQKLKNSNVNLKQVTKNDMLFLYELLKNKDPSTNISHKKMPTYAQHIKFIESKPYSKWYVIKFNNKKIGSVYLSKQNEVGIFIKKNMHSQKLGTSVLNILMKKNSSLFLFILRLEKKMSCVFFFTD